MNHASSTTDIWVLVEGPAPGDAEFLGKWLLAAVAADRELARQFVSNTNLKDQISDLEIVYMIAFAPAASTFLELFMKNMTCFFFSIGDELGNIFAIMAEVGFFKLTGHRYQMILPKTITGLNIENALLKLSATETDFYHHPELLVRCSTIQLVKEWDDRLNSLPWKQRAADRATLLE